MKKAPNFCLPNQNGDKRCLKDLLSEIKEDGFLLVYFYPRDLTSGCTTEAIGFSNMKRRFSNAKIKIVGISKLGHESKAKFVHKYNLKIELLADEECKVASKFGVYKSKNMYGRKVMGISRESFLINKHGNIIHHWDKVKPDTHPQEVLEFVKSLNK